MYFSISQHCFEFISYLLLLCFISIILSLVINVWGILLFILFASLLLLVIYLFRYNNICPANLIVDQNIIVWPSDGKIISITHGDFFRLTGEIITIQSEFFDCYTHVSPIYGYVLKVVITDKQNQYSNAVYIQIDNDNYSLDIIIYASNNILASSVSPIILIKEGQYVYASQPICLCMFGANVKFSINHNNKLNFNKIYIQQNTHVSQII